MLLLNTKTQIYVMAYPSMQINHAKGHGLRKGACTYAASGCTAAPPTSSIARRAEWSQGAIFDIYMQFAEVGDQYLGRVLAGLDSLSSDFACMPPRFSCGMENADVAEAMRICFGNSMQLCEAQYGTSGTGFLLQILPSIIFHSDWILDCAAGHAGHPLGTIPIMSRPELLSRLKLLVTNAKTQVVKPTGIPPHIISILKADENLDMTKGLMEVTVGAIPKLRNAVHEAIEESALNAGQITTPRVFELLEQFEGRMLVHMSRMNTGESAREIPARLDNAPQCTDGYQTYCYKGRFWDTPQGWIPPRRTLLKVGWNLWLLGQPSNRCTRQSESATTEPAPIRPFRFIKRVEQKGKDILQHSWRPIFKLMEAAPQQQIPSIASDITSEIIDTSFEIGMTAIKNRASYIWATPQFQKTNPSSWCTSQWCKMTKHSAIRIHGTDRDRLLLPADTRYTKQRKISHTH